MLKDICDRKRSGSCTPKSQTHTHMSTNTCLCRASEHSFCFVLFCFVSSRHTIDKITILHKNSFHIFLKKNGQKKKKHGAPTQHGRGTNTAHKWSHNLYTNSVDCPKATEPIKDGHDVCSMYCTVNMLHDNTMRSVHYIQWMLPWAHGTPTMTTNTQSNRLKMRENKQTM